MRNSAVICGVMAVFAFAASGVGQASPDGVVRLDDPGALAALRAANPNHYARAEKILAAANQICKPGPDKVTYASFDAREISCAHDLLRTSNPAKREIHFRLDQTRYAALVALTDDPARTRKLNLE
jgi:hypothetical protein